MIRRAVFTVPDQEIDRHPFCSSVPVPVTSNGSDDK
jgi:hypothetical protein